MKVAIDIQECSALMARLNIIKHCGGGKRALHVRYSLSGGSRSQRAIPVQGSRVGQSKYARSRMRQEHIGEQV